MKADRPKTAHLLRGSPCVRSWSRYQQTVPNWTLCGIDRRLGSKNRAREPVTEDAAEVTCRYCRILMRTTATIPNPGAERP